MAARYGLGRMSESREFSKLQNKLDNLYDNYNNNCNVTNYNKCAELIEESSNVHNKLHSSLTDISIEGGYSSCLPRPYYRLYSPYYYHYYPYYCSSYYPYSSLISARAAALAASTCLNNDLTLYSTLTRKNAQIADLTHKYTKDVNNLEHELTNTKINNIDLKAELNETKAELTNEKFKSSTNDLANQAHISDLKTKLTTAQAKLACLEPKAELAADLEREINSLRDEIRYVRSKNNILEDQNHIQREIIRSRPCSPVIFHSRPCSPCYIRSRSPSPCLRLSRSCSRAASPCCITSPISPLSPNHCTQVIRQDSLIARFNDFYSRDRLNAMDTLRIYSCDYENNQRIVFATVQEAFSAAKRAFSDWKIRVRSSLLLTHCGHETLEEAVQNYINRNVDLYDLPSLVSDVIIGLNRNHKITLPLGVSYSVINSFIREACRLAWEMSALAYPLDTAFALDAEVIDESRYRRTFDSEFSAPLINHHVWPCLMQGGSVVVKGEACTKRGASLSYRICSPVRCRSRSISPLRRSRSCRYY